MENKNIILKFYSLSVILISISLISCSKAHNEVTIVNNVTTHQQIYFNCQPQNIQCPYHIPQGGKDTFKNIADLTIVSNQKIYIIHFPENGEFSFQLKDIIGHKRPINLKGKCTKVQLYTDHEVIDCNSGKLIHSTDQ